MGAEYSSRPTLPEGGVCLAIEHDSAGCGPCGRRQWSDGPRPAWLSMRDGDWAAFSSEVGQLVRSYAPEGWGHVFMLVGFLVGLFVFHPSLGIVRTLDFELSASIGLMMFCMIGGLFAMLAVSIGGRRYNERVDEKIDAVCRAAAARANGGAITFVRLWTAPCKPKGARTFRAVYVYPLVPPGGARSSQGVGRFAAAAGYPTPVPAAPPLTPRLPCGEQRLATARPCAHRSPLPPARVCPSPARSRPPPPSPSPPRRPRRAVTSRTESDCPPGSMGRARSWGWSAQRHSLCGWGGVTLAAVNRSWLSTRCRSRSPLPRTAPRCRGSRVACPCPACFL